MKKILFIILILFSYTTAYAEFIRPVDNIISTKADIDFIKNGKINKKDTLNGEVTFHYNGLMWEEYSEDVANTFNDLYGGYFLKIEFIKQGKNAALKQIYHIPQAEVKKLLTMSTSFNKDTYMTVTIPVVAILENDNKAEIAGHYDNHFKAYTDKGKFILEWKDVGDDGVSEKLSFDQAVLLKVWQVLLQNTVY